MPEDEFAYYDRRAAEELVAAAKARSVYAARIHRDLADLFRVRAQELRTTKQLHRSVDAA
jgi:TolB-like protein